MKTFPLVDDLRGHSGLPVLHLGKIIYLGNFFNLNFYIFLFIYLLVVNNEKDNGINFWAKINIFCC